MSNVAMESVEAYVARLQAGFPDAMIDADNPRGEVTMTVSPSDLLEVSKKLRNEFGYEMCVDICGVDYLTFGYDEWDTDASSDGFSRGVEGSLMGRFKRGENPNGIEVEHNDSKRFASVMHLVSLQHNQRLRVRTFAQDSDFPVVPSVTTVWPGVNWFERESFDLFGIIYEGHPDLRRILTDYGFVGHPFRKDFPLIGNVEVRYDEDQRRVVYQPVSIEPRVGVPRVIRDDARFETAAGESAQRVSGKQ